MLQKIPIYLFMFLCLAAGVYLLLPQDVAPPKQAATTTRQGMPQLNENQSAALNTSSKQSVAASEEAPNPNTSGESADNLITTSNKQELATTLAGMTDFSVDELLQMKDLDAFSEQILNLATAGVFTEPPDSSAAEPVNFSLNPAGAGDYMEFSRSFPASTKRIYANYSTVNQPYPSILAKWYRTDEPELYDFRRHRVDPAKNEAFIWHLMPEGWQPGEYRLDIISADEELRIIASGQFVVQ